MYSGYLSRLLVFQVEQVTPDVPLPGLKQKGKEAEAIGKGGASGPGAADQVIIYLEGSLVHCIMFFCLHKVVLFHSRKLSSVILLVTVAP